MRKPIAAMLLICALAIPAFAQTQQKQDIGPVVIEGWQTLDMTKDVWTFSGPNLRIVAKDGQFEAKASKMVVSFAGSKSQGAIGSLDSINLLGGVWLHMQMEGGRSVTATADSASVDYVNKQQAILTGNVTIKSEDPSIFIGPVIATGDKAVIDFKPGEEHLKIESYKGTSKVEFTPQPPKKGSEQEKSANND